MDDRALQPLIDHYIALLRPGNANDDCPNLSAAPLAAADTVADADASYNMWHDLDSDISFTLTVANFTEDGTNDRADGQGPWACAWYGPGRTSARSASSVRCRWFGARPSPFSTAGAIKRDNTNTSVTTSIGWELERDSGFDYVLRLLTTGKDTGEATTDQADCAGGQAIQSPDSVGRQDVSIFHTERNPAPYTIYQLCARAENDYGASEWTFVGRHAADGSVDASGAIATSRPAAPSTPALDQGQSNVVEDDTRRDTVHSLFWSVRHKQGTPKDGAHYRHGGLHVRRGQRPPRRRASDSVQYG